MAIIYSPVDQEELTGPYKPYPRSAFLMLQANVATPPEGRQMEALVREQLAARRVRVLTAAEVRRTADYLRKIVDLIRGCGAGVAIFSDGTPARTLGNIFFEVGVCLTLGKPVQVVWTGREALPSDFVRTEYIRFDPQDEASFGKNLEAAFETIFEEQAEYFRTLGDIALGADEVDYELAFDRYKQAVLLSDDPAARAAIAGIGERLRALGQARKPDPMINHRKRLIATIEAFLRLLPRSMS